MLDVVRQRSVYGRAFSEAAGRSSHPACVGPTSPSAVAIASASLLFAMCLGGVSRCDGMQYKRARHRPPRHGRVIASNGLSSHRSPLVPSWAVQVNDAFTRRRRPTTVSASFQSVPAIGQDEPARHHQAVGLRRACSRQPGHLAQVQTLSSNFTAALYCSSVAIYRPHTVHISR